MIMIFCCRHFICPTAIRICYCNGTWGPEPCQASVGLVEELVCANNILKLNISRASRVLQILKGKAELGLELLLQLPPNSITNTQRLEVLRSAFVQQSKIGVTSSFVQVASYNYNQECIREGALNGSLHTHKFHPAHAACGALLMTFEATE